MRTSKCRTLKFPAVNGIILSYGIAAHEGCEISNPQLCWIQYVRPTLITERIIKIPFVSAASGRRKDRRSSIGRLAVVNA